MSQSFFTSIGGIKAAQTMVDVVSDNLANINTIGFKQSSVTFSDVYYKTLSTGTSTSVISGGTNPTQIGFGTKVSTINRDFTSGTTQSTGNNTDMAITGGGFFCALDPNNEAIYTRAGNFTLDSEGNLTTAKGAKILGIGSSFSATSGTNTVKVPLVIETTTVPNTTNFGTKDLNDFNNLKCALGTFSIDVTKTTGSTCSVPVNITGCANMGDIVAAINSALDSVAYGADSTDNTGGGDDTFDRDDIAVTLANGKLNLAVSTAGGTTVSALAFDAGTSNFLAASGLDTNTMTTDPATGDHLYSTNVLDYKQIVNPASNPESGVNYSEMGISEDGKIEIKYTNGDKMTVMPDPDATDGSLMFKYTTADGIVIKGLDVTVDPTVARPSNLQMAIANFINPAGLVADGSNAYSKGANSGDPTYGIPGTSGFSTLQSGTLESSNVDMTMQFANMIIAQRAIEANSRVFSTQNEILKSLSYMGQ